MKTLVLTLLTAVTLYSCNKPSSVELLLTNNTPEKLVYGFYMYPDSIIDTLYPYQKNKLVNTIMYRQKAKHLDMCPCEGVFNLQLFNSNKRILKDIKNENNWNKTLENGRIFKSKDYNRCTFELNTEDLQ